MLEKCPKCGDPRGDAGGLMCQANGCLLVDSDQRKDAEIARLKAELEAERFDTRILRRNLDQARDDHDAEAARLRRALAAGPAALRKRADEAADIGAYLDAAFDRKSADLVKAAQEAAMKEGT